MTRAKVFLIALLTLAAATAPAMAAMPTPVLRFVSANEYYVGPALWVRYELSVDNRNAFAQALFQPTPNLPNCYASDSAAMVYVYDIGNPGQAIHVFCPANRNDLASIGYALKKSPYQTGHVMIRILDKLTNQGVWSNIVKAAPTPLPPVTGVDPAHPPPPSTSVPAVGAEIRTGANLCLDVHAPEIGTNGGRVQAWACHGQQQQRWRYDRVASALRVASGLCLDVRAGINQNGNSVQVWSCNGQRQQQWTPLKNGALRNAGGLCLDVHAADQTRNGARVQIWQCNGSLQQRFLSSAF